MRITALIALTLGLAAQSSCAGEPSGTTRPQDTLAERAEVSLGKQAQALLDNKKVPAFESRGEVSVLRGASVMVHIAGGRFDQRRIEAFEMDRTEVTVAAYGACVEAGSCETPDAGESSNYGRSGRDEHPVNEVSAEDAAAYCEWAGKRLPTEWEWEWAARGREEGRKYPWGSSAPSCSLAVMDAGGDGCGRERTWPVGSKPDGASRDGLMDMAGNVWEWTASTDGGKRVLRGSGWSNDIPSIFRASYRYSIAPSSRSGSNGFRCARTAN